MQVQAFIKYAVLPMYAKNNIHHETLVVAVNMLDFA